MISVDTILEAMAKAISEGDCNCAECCAKNGLSAIGELAAVVPREAPSSLPADARGAPLAEAWSAMVRVADLTLEKARSA